ncbi:tRNA methyltransferase 10 homolog B [Otolemur garnettii]|uniref:tRNA methyltransferase 10 homolog B n=1 Tax=Otolemur garnettii TaxID=30611 RepID=UPI00064458F0|nr:tRNA methyltransferase 10 homolog B [Otolemur garnettii]
MDWKLDGSTQKIESPVLQGHEGVFEDRGEDGISESFQLLQIDVECQEGETLPTGSTAWCSKNVQRKQRHWEKVIAAKKSKRKQEKERRKANRAENPGICPQHSKRFLRALTKEKLLEAKHSGPRICIDLSMTHHMSKKELSRLAGQIRRLYGSNKKADKPFWICLTGFTTDSPLYEECLRMNDGFSSYLEYMVRCQNGKNYHSKILAINQVFDILSTYFDTHNWPEALKKGVSSGKGYVLRNSLE